jgi:flagellar L-ring protein precursor FlgH|uniref:Flagellar L-ring protein n=1 Tax=Desulfobacca acetoxidans TaxID=60893 RepID=A0A7V6A6L2_9BACT
MKISHGHIILFGVLLLAVTGCGTLSKAKYHPEVPIASPPLPPTPPPQEGSLWTGRQPYGLIADARPANVGDLVTISITETAKASELANTNVSRDSGVKVGINSLFGISLPMKSFSDKTVNASTALEGTVGNVTNGQGKTERQSSFTSFLTARVIQVLPNQNLMIQGQRNLRINNETEVVTLTGIVRPQDIDRNNTVPSTKVAEARVTISGVGVVSDKQKVGWFQRIFDHVYPF